MAVIDQGPVVYSCELDGDDDQARVEVTLDRLPAESPPDGDVLFRL